MTVAEAPAPAAMHRRLGLTDVEVGQIHELLGRAPNDLELAMFSVMWSEHCSYKSSKSLLRSLPSGGSDVLAGPGENAGVVSVGDGLAVAFKIESHNHPSAVEPYQGAATGVGGILRDIVAMGARPVALLDALKFGWPDDHRTRRLVDGIVRGVGGYGNCVGVPTVGGELTFDPTYTGNPLVNVMCVGIVAEGAISRAIAPTPGSLAVLFGSSTGRDGIGGASVLASANFDEGSAAMRPSVQIGDPFAGKLLIEATLELVEGGLVEGMQDLGAAGLTCATSEVAARGGTGIRVDLTAVPLREQDMEPFELMISESQERMLAIVRPERLNDVLRVVRRWGLRGEVIGEITDDGDVVVVDGGAEIARVPARALATDAPEQRHEAAPPTRRRLAPAPGETAFAHDGLPERGMDPG
ncbi:MAG TPA: phosphoribosylformylglycinamidine synthase subunit PurL, partial [Candidatus Limnocylindrales bacterium]